MAGMNGVGRELSQVSKVKDESLAEDNDIIDICPSEFGLSLPGYSSFA